MRVRRKQRRLDLAHRALNEDPERRSITDSFDRNGMVVVVTFSSLARIWEVCSTMHSPPELFFFFFFSFFEVEISSRTLITLFMPGSIHNGSES